MKRPILVTLLLTAALALGLFFNRREVRPHQYVASRIADIQGLQSSLASSGLTLISFRAGLPYAGLSDGTQTTVTYRIRIPTAYACTNPYIAVANWYSGSGQHEQAGNAPVTYKASLEDPTSTSGSSGGTSLIPIYWANGSRSITLDVSASTLSAPIPVSLPANWVVFVRIEETVGTLGQKWPLSGHVIAGGSGTIQPDGRGGNDGWTNGSDVTDSGTVTPASGNCGGPMGLYAYVTGGAAPAVTAEGDSTLLGSNDSYGLTALTTTHGGTEFPAHGWLYRFCTANNIPVLNGGVGGETAQNAAGYVTTFRRSQILGLGTSTYVIQYGTNDVAGRTAAQIEADILTIARRRKVHGCRVIVATMFPKEASDSDDFQTASGQTPIATDSVRQTVNNWIRAPKSAGSGNSILFDAGGNVDMTADPCGQVEVNASNVLTTNGGRWITETPVLTCAAGNCTNSGATITDTVDTFTSAMIGMTFLCDTGTHAHTQALITSFTDSHHVGLSAAVTMNGTDDHASIGKLPTSDGVHGNPCTYERAAHALTYSMFVVH